MVITKDISITNVINIITKDINSITNVIINITNVINIITNVIININIIIITNVINSIIITTGSCCSRSRTNCRSCHQSRT